MKAPFEVDPEKQYTCTIERTETFALIGFKLLTVELAGRVIDSHDDQLLLLASQAAAMLQDGFGQGRWRI